MARALGTVVVTVRGRPSESDGELLRAILDDLIRNQGNRDVAVDLRRLVDMRSDCTEAFSAADGWAAASGASFTLCDPNELVARDLRDAGLERRIRDTRRGADRRLRTTSTSG